MSKKKSPETSDHKEIADRHQADPIQGDAANNDHHYTLDPTASDGNPPRQDNVEKRIKIKDLEGDLPLRRLFLLSAARAHDFLDAHMRLRCYIETHYPHENIAEMHNEEMNLRSQLDPRLNPYYIVENTIETLTEEELN